MKFLQSPGARHVLERVQMFFKNRKKQLARAMPRVESLQQVT